MTERGQNARNCCHSSPAGAVSIGPSALDRRTGAVRSSVRSHRIVGSRPDVPRRHPCRPATLLGGVCHALGAQSSRPPAPCLADRRIGRSSEASDHSGRAVQRARGGALSRASALRPPAAAFLTTVRATRSRCGSGRAGRLESLAARPEPSASQPEGAPSMVFAALAAFSFRSSTVGLWR